MTNVNVSLICSRNVLKEEAEFPNKDESNVSHPGPQGAHVFAPSLEDSPPFC